MGVHVPDDVISNILPRVPAKSVGRFKCLSKEWHSFLSSKMFKNMHIDHHQNNLKLLVFSKTETSFEFTTIDCEAPLSDKGLTPARRPLPQLGDTTPHRIRILTSFHGLVCLGIIKDRHDFEYSGLILWNPLTDEYKRLSKSNSQIMACNSTHSKFGLYYSCCEDDYKLLFVNLFGAYAIAYIYSLKSDSWRKVDAFQSRHILYHGRWSQGTYLNENLYFLLQNSNNGRLSLIIRFDTKTERLSKIETPNVDDIPNAYYYFATIMVISDCIHVCVKYDISIHCDNGFGWTTCIKLWKLDKYENLKEVVNYQLKHHLYDPTISHLYPYHLMKNGIWFMTNHSSYDLKIYKVDLKKKMHITEKGKGKEEGNIYDEFEYAEVRVDGNKNIVAGDRYIETFVSPNRYMK